MENVWPVTTSFPGKTSAKRLSLHSSRDSFKTSMRIFMSERGHIRKAKPRAKTFSLYSTTARCREQNEAENLCSCTAGLHGPGDRGVPPSQSVLERAASVAGGRSEQPTPLGSKMAQKGRPRESRNAWLLQARLITKQSQPRAARATVH